MSWALQEILESRFGPLGADFALALEMLREDDLLDLAKHVAPDSLTEIRVRVGLD